MGPTASPSVLQWFLLVPLSEPDWELMASLSEHPLDAREPLTEPRLGPTASPSVLQWVLLVPLSEPDWEPMASLSVLLSGETELLSEPDWELMASLSVLLSGETEPP